MYVLLTEDNISTGAMVFSSYIAEVFSSVFLFIKMSIKTRTQILLNLSIRNIIDSIYKLLIQHDTSILPT